MFLRLSRTTDMTPEETDAMAAGLADGSSFTAEHFTGDACLGYAAGADRGGGRIVVVSLWPTREAMADSRQAADRARAERTATLATAPVVDEYEVVVERTAGPGWGEPDGWIRLSRTAGLVDTRVPRVADTFGDHVDELAALDGFGGYLVGQDVKHGRVTAISRWRTRDSLDASEPVSARAREARLATMKPRREPLVDTYEVIALTVARSSAVL